MILNGWSCICQALREASAQAQQRAEEEEKFVEERKAHYGAMFEEYQGRCKTTL
jgi:hypothetical protein